MAGKILRKKKNKDFVVLDTTCLKDKNLSFKAKGLHSYLMQLPDDWEINISDLKNRSKDGRDSVSAAMNELIAAGYVHRQLSQNSKGVFEGYDYDVFERPESALSVNGKAVNGLSVNGKSVTNKNYIKQELSKEQLNKSAENENEQSPLKEAEHPTQKYSIPPPPAAPKFPAAWSELLSKAAKKPVTKMKYSSERVYEVETPEEIATALMVCGSDQLFLDSFKRIAGLRPEDQVFDIFTAFLERRLIDGGTGYQTVKRFREHLLSFPGKYLYVKNAQQQEQKQQPKINNAVPVYR